jgi:hypothetical protein
MGFASAISELGLHGSYQWTSILGFNLGIELGQLLFLLTFLAVAKGLRTRGWSPVLEQRSTGFTIEGWASALALAVGLFWLAERLIA